MNDSVLLAKNKGTHQTIKPEEYHHGKCILSMKTSTFDNPLDKFYFLFLPRRNFFVFYKMDQKRIIIHKSLILIKEIKRFAYEHRTETYTIVLKNEDIYKVNFPDEELDQIFDRIFTSKLKNWQTLKTKNSIEYYNALFLFFLSKISYKKKESVIVNEFIFDPINFKTFKQHPVLSSIKALSINSSINPFERRIWFGNAKISDNFLLAQNLNNSGFLKSKMKEVFCFFCTSKQLINFEQVLFPEVSVIYKNQWTNIELPEWIETDMVYLFSTSGQNSTNTNLFQLSNRFVLPFQLF